MLARLLIVAMVCGFNLQGVVLADTSTQGSDAEITNRVIGKLSRADGDLAQRVHVSTVNGIVTLEGKVYTSSQKIKLLSDASRVDGVIKVQDRLRVQM